MVEAGLSTAGGLLVGAALLLAGRRLYWLVVGVAGFAIGFLLATGLFGADPGWMALVVGAVIGVAAALVAVLFQKVAVVAAGFLAAALLVLRALTVQGQETEWWVWLLAVLAGIVGGLITRWLFEAGLIVLSSLAGSALVVRTAGLSIGEYGEAIPFLALAALGIVVQAASLHRLRRESPTPPKAA